MTHHKRGNPMVRVPVTRVMSETSTDSPNQWDNSFGAPYQGKSPTGDGHSNGSSASNQPTPATSNSSQHHSNGISFSPHSESLDNMQAFMSNSEPKLNSGFPDGPFAPSIMLSQAQHNSSGMNTDGRGATQTNNYQNIAINSQQDTSNGFGSIFGGTGFTPGPSGFTPGPSGSGLTPGPSGMTPNWNDMQVPDNTEWMYGDWRNGDASKQSGQ